MTGVTRRAVVYPGVLALASYPRMGLHPDLCTGQASLATETGGSPGCLAGQAPDAEGTRNLERGDLPLHRQPVPAPLRIRLVAHRVPGPFRKLDLRRC